MSANQKTVLAALASLFCGCALEAGAVVIVGDAVVSPSSPPPRQLLALTQSIPPGQGLFAIFLDPLDSSQIRFTFAGIAEGYGLYAADAGVAFDSAFALSTVPVVTNSAAGPGTSVQLLNLGQSSYFAYWDDRNFNGIPDGNDNYGWVQLTRTASGLVASSSATAVGGGIIVGSTSQIPEPAPFILLVLGMAFVTCAHKKFRRTQRPASR